MDALRYRPQTDVPAKQADSAGTVHVLPNGMPVRVTTGDGAPVPGAPPPLAALFARSQTGVEV